MADVEEMKAAVQKHWPDCYPGAYGEGIWWSNPRGEMVIIGASWSDAYAKLPADTSPSEPKEQPEP